MSNGKTMSMCCPWINIRKVFNGNFVDTRMVRSQWNTKPETLKYRRLLASCPWKGHRIKFLPCRSIRQGLVSYSFLLYPVGVSDRVLYLTRFFFLLLSSSGNTSKTYISVMSWSMLTRLGHKNPLALPQPVIQPAWGQRSCRGHRGQKRSFH